MKTLLKTGAAACAFAAALTAHAFAAEPAACESHVAAVTGGPLPPADSDTIVLRWLANANFEFGYKGKVYLFDSYFDRKARSHNVGFKAADVKKAEAIFVSHAHFDHISDIGPVANQTGAPVVGAPITADVAKKLGVPEKQIVVAKGGESLKFGDATIEVALGQHSTIQPGLTDIYASLYKNDTRPNTAEENSFTAFVQSKGSFDPKIITEGVRELAKKLGPVDVAIIAYQVHAVAETQISYTWPFIELFQPKLFLPAHHDASFGNWLDLGLEPLFTKLRDEKPGTKFLAPLYRSPICVSTTGANRGAVTSFKY